MLSTVSMQAPAALLSVKAYPTERAITEDTISRQYYVNLDVPALSTLIATVARFSVNHAMSITLEYAL